MRNREILLNFCLGYRIGTVVNRRAVCSGDFGEEGVDRAEQELLIAPRQLMQALDAPEEAAVGRGRGADGARGGQTKNVVGRGAEHPEC